MESLESLKNSYRFFLFCSHETTITKNIFSAISQSIVFGAITTFLFFWIWNEPIKKFNFEIEPFHRATVKEIHWIGGDFNGDGNSERIRCFRGTDSKWMDVVHYDKNGNLTEHYHFTKSEWNYRQTPKVFDIDEDGTQELLFFTTRNDSIFFNAFNLATFELIIDHHYFNKFERKRKVYACRSEFYEFGDFDKNGKNELFLYFDAGFGLYPRGIFKMEFPSLKITASPTEYMFIRKSYFKDFDNDGTPEILTHTSAPSNSSVYKKFTDTMSYITVLDYNLNFLFEPIPFPGAFSYASCIPAFNNDSIIYAMHYSRSNNKEPLRLIVLNKNGEILNQKSWRNIDNPEGHYMGLKIVNRVPYLFLRGIGHKIIKYMIDTGAGFFFFKYQRNQYYYLLYIIYALVFITVTGTIRSILFFQKKNIEKKWQIEKQLSELQFNSVKNQLNPHFMFNTLNSVAYLIESGQKDEAYDFLSVNSRMIQRVMDDAKEVKRTLKNEIGFTKDYLTIQQHRFKERFSSEFTIHPDVDLNFEIPKMCIHTYVENAVKHGFKNTKTGGLLQVDIAPLINGVHISVTDNGMGLKAASDHKSSSGNGLSIMNEFYRLFEKYNGYKIEIKFIDLNKRDGDQTGTRVELKIHKDKR